MELVGTAVFVFGVTAVLQRKEIKAAGQAFGIGLALMIGLVVSGSISSYIQSIALVKSQKGQDTTQTEKNGRTYPREVYISFTGATLNPAVSLAVTEKTDSQLRSNGVLPAEGEKSYSRFSLEVIAATLIGAALGGNLFLLVNYRNKDEE